MKVDFSHWQVEQGGTVRNVVAKLMPQLPPGEWDIHVPGATQTGDLILNPVTLRWELRPASALGIIARQAEPSTRQATDAMSKVHCDTCRFFCSQRHECRGRAPTPYRIEDDYRPVWPREDTTDWPRVDSTDWCGEWQPRGG